MNKATNKQIESIIESLRYEQDSNERPGAFMETEYYIKCSAKAEAYEYAIDVIKSTLKIK